MANGNPWDGFPIPEPFVDPQNRFITPGLTHSDRPEAFKMPTIAEMKGMVQTPEGRAELERMLDHFGIGNSLNYLKGAASDYVQRMTTLTGQAFQDEVNNLISRESGRGLLGMSRRMHQQFAALRDIDGNVNQLMIRVTEGDDSMCENCEALGGEIRTYADWAGDMPGSQSCLGGDNCRCTLHPVD